MAPPPPPPPPPPQPEPKSLEKSALHGLTPGWQAPPPPWLAGQPVSVPYLVGTPPYSSLARAMTILTPAPEGLGKPVLTMAMLGVLPPVPRMLGAWKVKE